LPIPVSMGRRNPVNKISESFRPSRPRQRFETIAEGRAGIWNHAERTLHPIALLMTASIDKFHAYGVQVCKILRHADPHIEPAIGGSGSATAMTVRDCPAGTV
jgi:hypothetical protein